jgi:hypothetical protein
VVDQWAQPGSPAAIELETLRQYYLASGLVARIVPSRTYVVVSTVTLEGRGRARVQLCAVDGSWQMDSRGTTSTADDIVWNDALVSRRETQVLVSDGVRWRRYSVEVTAEWPGENRCGPRSTS